MTNSCTLLYWFIIHMGHLRKYNLVQCKNSYKVTVIFSICVCNDLWCTFVGAGHPLNGSFVIVVLSNRKSKDPDLELQHSSLHDILRSVCKFVSISWIKMAVCPTVYYLNKYDFLQLRNLYKTYKTPGNVDNLIIYF